MDGKSVRQKGFKR